MRKQYGACARNHELVMEKAKAGSSLAEIAREVGTSPETVKKYLARFGFEKEWSKGSLGSKNASWKGGRRVDKRGDVWILSPDHPNKTTGGYMLESRLVMEKHLGHLLDKRDRVLHLNGDKSDNRLENLEFAEFSGGRKHCKGYVMRYAPEHPSAQKNGYVFAHRLVMEAHLGRLLLPNEVVHHQNGVKHDNRIENLQVFDSNADHLAHELKGRTPKWTEEGLARMRAGVEKSASRRRGKSRHLWSLPDAPQSPESEHRSPE